MLIKAFLVGLLIAAAEVINGNVRVRLLHKRLGKKRAKFYSFFSGTAAIYAIGWLLLGWINPQGYMDCLIIGTTWLIIMLCLDLYFARFVFHVTWKNIRDDFNPGTGNLLGIGMLLLFLSPFIVFRLQLA